MPLTIENVAEIYRSKNLSDRTRHLKAAILTRKFSDSHDPTKTDWEMYDSLLLYARDNDAELLEALRETILVVAQEDQLLQRTEYTEGILDFLVNSGCIEYAPILIRLIEEGTTELIEELIGTLASFSNQEFFEDTVRDKLQEWFLNTKFSAISLGTIMGGLRKYSTVKESWWIYVTHWLEFCELEKPDILRGHPEKLIFSFFLHMNESLYKEGLTHLDSKYQPIAEAMYQLAQKTSSEK